MIALCLSTNCTIDGRDVALRTRDSLHVGLGLLLWLSDAEEHCIEIRPVKSDPMEPTSTPTYSGLWVEFR